MIYFDTHILEGLARRGVRDLSKEARRVIDKEYDLRISPIVALELENLYEIGRIRASSAELVKRMKAEIGLRVCDLPFPDVALQAARENWTRDVFDRMIVAQARIAKAHLITRDHTMQANYARAIG